MLCSTRESACPVWWSRRRGSRSGSQPDGRSAIGVIESSLSDRAQYLAKLFLADKVSHKKARKIENDFRMFRRFQGWLGSVRRSAFDWSNLTQGLARAFLAHGVEHTADKGNDFSRLRTFYRWGVARQHRDFDPGLFHILQSITAVGNSKGHSVRFRDSVKGPFSPDELLLIGP
jgi:hypothetical protein